MGKRFASFYRCLAFARFWKVKFWRSFIKCQYFNDGWTDFHKNIYLYIFILGFFSKTGKTRVTHRVKMITRWPGDPDVKDDPNDPNDPLTRWPNDPVPCLTSSLGLSAERLFLSLALRSAWTKPNHLLTSLTKFLMRDRFRFRPNNLSYSWSGILCEDVPRIFRQSLACFQKCREITHFPLLRLDWSLIMLPVASVT